MSLTVGKSSQHPCWAIFLWSGEVWHSIHILALLLLRAKGQGLPRETLPAHGPSSAPHVCPVSGSSSWGSGEECGCMDSFGDHEGKQRSTEIQGLGPPATFRKPWTTGLSPLTLLTSGASSFFCHGPSCTL